MKKIIETLIASRTNEYIFLLIYCVVACSLLNMASMILLNNPIGFFMVILLMVSLLCSVALLADKIKK